MARAHPVSAIIIELAREEGMVIRPAYPPCVGLALELLLDPVPDLEVNDRRMKAVVDLPFVAQPSDIDRVRQDPVKVASGHRGAAGPSARPARPNGRTNVLGVESRLQPHRAANFEIAAEEGTLRVPRTAT